MKELYFESIYAFDRTDEPVFVGIPFKKGELFDEKKIAVKNEKGEQKPSFSSALSTWEDGSVKWLFTDFLADIPALRSAKYFLAIEEEPQTIKGIVSDEKVTDTGKITLDFSKGELFEINGSDVTLSPMCFSDKDNGKYSFTKKSVQTEQYSPLKETRLIKGVFTAKERNVEAEIRVTCYWQKSYFDIGITIINTDTSPLRIESFSLVLKKPFDGKMRQNVAHSNYRTIYTSSEGEAIENLIDANYLLFESNESNPEVFYGTFFGDMTDEKGGVCATVYQAQQNYPKAVSIEAGVMNIDLMPGNVEDITLFMGMAKEHIVRIYLHKGLSPETLSNESTLFQLPDRPAVDPSVFKESGVFSPLIFTDEYFPKAERYFAGMADGHTRSYGVVSWGDSPDMGYTQQGRGGGKLVWVNNEYDFPHACALQYVRTGVRRFLEYLFVTGKHQYEIDVCHYSDEPAHLGGQWEHCAEHINARVMVCSHQWLEGMLDLYHLSGDKRAYDAAVGIAKNVINILNGPEFKTSGEMSARETGWALRALTAMYTETGDARWLESCDFIVEHFRKWGEDYGVWLSSYMDGVKIRVVFMIAVAISSLYRYYLVCQNEETKKEIKKMIVTNAEDLVDNARLKNGLFYYKELPGLKRDGNNPCILEALAYAYELTGNRKFIDAGYPTFELILNRPNPSSMSKQHVESSVLYGAGSTKNFAQALMPCLTYFKFATELGLYKE